MTVPRETIDALLAVSVPPSGTREWQEWQSNWRALGPGAASRLVEVLEHGTEDEQYSAQIALRLFGYEVWADGYGPDLNYELTEPGPHENRIIKPKITPEPYPPL
jgi:hypothetical protein